MEAVPLRRPRSQRWRPLTPGETAMAALLFRDAIDYRRVRIHSRRYMPFQPDNCAMTPNGHLYFHASCFLDDYADASSTNGHWFMHEMVLLWQSAHLQSNCKQPKRTAAVSTNTSCLPCEQHRRTLKHAYHPVSAAHSIGIGPSLVECFRAREQSGFAASGGGPVIIALGSLENA
jgi:hypothetical protein